ncbi:MAG: CDP-diacylglycerol--serine O-phosphatidyltransferase, partial [Ferruginibacter sp.]
GLVVRYDNDLVQYVDIPESITMASLFIGLAAVVDFLDGFVARLFNASSELGKQLDSLADVVSFGVAPAMIMYQFLRMSYSRVEDGLNVSYLFLLPALIIAGAAAYRLGKFNIDSSQQYGFKGVPTPAVGLLIASFPLIYWNAANHEIALLLLNKWVLYSLIIILSWLMVSNIPLLALKFKDKTLKGNLPFIILVLITIISIPLFHWAAAIIVFASYIILSLLFKPQR